MIKRIENTINKIKTFKSKKRKVSNFLIENNIPFIICDYYKWEGSPYKTEAEILVSYKNNIYSFSIEDNYESFLEIISNFEFKSGRFYLRQSIKRHYKRNYFIDINKEI